MESGTANHRFWKTNIADQCSPQAALSPLSWGTPPREALGVDMPAFGMNALPVSTSADHGGDAVKAHPSRLPYLFLAGRGRRLGSEIGKVSRGYVEQLNTQQLRFSQLFKVGDDKSFKILVWLCC